MSSQASPAREIQSASMMASQDASQPAATDGTTRTGTSPNATPKKPQSNNKRLPLARVKKIAKMDEDVNNLSNAAALVIASATERFAAYFAEQAFFYTLAERKKGLNYSHCAAAVARLPQLDFLSDVVPQRVPFRETAAGKAVAPARLQAEAEAVGQVLDGAAGKRDGTSAIPAWAQAKSASTPASAASGPAGVSITNSETAPVPSSGRSPSNATKASLSSILDPTAMEDEDDEDVEMEEN